MKKLIQASTTILAFEAIVFCAAYFWFGKDMDAALDTVFWAGFATCIGYRLIFSQMVTHSEFMTFMAVIALAANFHVGVGPFELLGVIAPAVACALIAAYTARRYEASTEPFPALFIAALPGASSFVGWPLYRLC